MLVLPCKSAGFLHRIQTLFLVKTNEPREKFQIAPHERTSAILARLAKASTKKPGLDRSVVFQSTSGNGASVPHARQKSFSVSANASEYDCRNPSFQQDPELVSTASI